MILNNQNVGLTLKFWPKTKILTLENQNFDNLKILKQIFTF